jgi:hypothetical protein
MKIYLQKVISKNILFVRSWNGSGSISHWYESADMDPYPTKVSRICTYLTVSISVFFLLVSHLMIECKCLGGVPGTCRYLMPHCQYCNSTMCPVILLS